MTNFRYRSTGEYPVSKDEVARRSGAALPPVWDESVLDFLGVDPVFLVPVPDVDRWHRAEEAAPVQFPDGSWRQSWAVSDIRAGLGAAALAELEERFAAEDVAARAALVASLVAAVKAEAGRRILLVAPDWQQRNLTARAAELALLYPGTRGDELPEPERSEYLAGQATWEQIKAIRTASNNIEVALVAAPDPGAIDITDGWP